MESKPMMRKQEKRRNVFGYDAYLQYLKSDEWKSFKNRYLKSNYKKKCYICWKPYIANGSFDFHHKTYNNLGKERMIDVIILCRDCHQSTHNLVRNGKSNLWGAARKLRRYKVRQLAELYGFRKMRDAKALIRKGVISLTELTIK
jgi:hypothetical protein